MDGSSLSNLDDFEISHYNLKLKVNFDKKILEGSVTHELEIKRDNVVSLYLDAKALKIISVSNRLRKCTFNYQKDERHYEELGG